MTRIAELKNQQKLDMCALCHSGLGVPQKSMFDFKPGDALSDYFFPEFTAPKRTAQMDVHGTQYQLFTASKCFMKSNDMNCSSCHTPHNSESNNMELFSQRSCTAITRLTIISASWRSCLQIPFAKNCIDCHMPALPSANITLLTNGKQSPTPDSIRTHLITIYKEETKKVLARLKSAS